MVAIVWPWHELTWGHGQHLMSLKQGPRSVIFVFACLCSLLPRPPQSTAEPIEKRHHCHSEIKNFHVT